MENLKVLFKKKEYNIKNIIHENIIIYYQGHPIGSGGSYYILENEKYNFIVSRFDDALVNNFYTLGILEANKIIEHSYGQTNTRSCIFSLNGISKEESIYEFCEEHEFTFIEKENNDLN